MFTNEQFEKARKSYGYSLVGLSRAGHVPFKTCREMETFHRDHLTSKYQADVVQGYLSTLYWGHYSGTDGVLRAGRALAKAEAARRSIEERTSIEIAAAIVRTSGLLINDGKIGQAALLLTHLPGVGFSFSSKICTFLDPETCGIADSIIAGKYSQFNFVTNVQGYLNISLENASRYEAYCEHLCLQAHTLNRSGSTWNDLDDERRDWRAVDIERAYFSIPGDAYFLD